MILKIASYRFTKGSLMFRLIKFLLTGYWDGPEWVIIKTFNVEDLKTKELGTRYIMRNKVSGELKKVDLI
jgi:hypothetical protein